MYEYHSTMQQRPRVSTQKRIIVRVRSTKVGGRLRIGSSSVRPCRVQQPETAHAPGSPQSQQPPACAW